MNRIRIQFDGACKNDPNANCPMGLGVAVFIDGEYMEELSRAVLIENHHKDGTSNIGEWLALIEALKTAEQLKKDYPRCRMSIHGDSQLIVNQFNLLWRIKESNFLEYFKEAREIGVKIGIEQINWLKREFNTHADELSKMALKTLQLKKYQLKGYHADSESRWIEYQSDFFQKVLKKLEEVYANQTNLDVDYMIWDTEENKEVELPLTK